MSIYNPFELEDYEFLKKISHTIFRRDYEIANKIENLGERIEFLKLKRNAYVMDFENGFTTLGGRLVVNKSFNSNVVKELYDDEIKDLKERNRLSKEQTQHQIKPGLERIIYKDYVSEFEEIENRLVENKLLTDKYIWIGNKTELRDFLVTIIGYNYILAGVKPIAARKFFEDRYGKDVDYISDIFRPSKQSKFDNAKAGFAFISAPSKTDRL